MGVFVLARIGVSNFQSALSAHLEQGWEPSEIMSVNGAGAPEALTYSIMMIRHPDWKERLEESKRREAEYKARASEAPAG